MDLARSLVVLSLSLAALACHDSGGGGGPNAVGLHVSASDFEFEGDLLVANVVEVFQDLNGDGDFSDAFIEVIDLGRKTRQRLPEVTRGFELGAGYVAFTVAEFEQGVDLNGDGDIWADRVLHVHDTRAGTTRNLALAVHGSGLNWKPFLAQEGALVAFVVSEADQGEDLDGDGEETHDLAFAYRADLDALEPLGLASATRPRVEDERVFLAVPEYGVEDRNGDGDAWDEVLAYWDARTRTSHGLERAVRSWNDEITQFGVDGALLAVAIPENEQGVDENGDGDLDDLLVEIRDLESGTIVATDLPAGHVTVGGGLVGLIVPEVTHTDLVGVDRNGDGDVLDSVAYFHDWLSGTLVNTEVAVGSFSSFASAPRYAARRATLVVPEAVDLNGDGDELDLELQLFDARTGLVESTGITVLPEAGIELDGEYLACAASTRERFGPLVIDLASGARTWLGASIQHIQIADGRAHYSVHERREGRDLNGDGDDRDVVQRTYDVRSARMLDTRLAVSSNSGFPSLIRSRGDRVAWNVPEQEQGRDLNGDGDQSDHVLHVVELP